MDVWSNENKNMYDRSTNKLPAIAIMAALVCAKFTPKQFMFKDFLRIFSHFIVFAFFSCLAHKESAKSLRNV